MRQSRARASEQTSRLLSPHLAYRNVAVNRRPSPVLKDRLAPPPLRSTAVESHHPQAADAGSSDTLIGKAFDQLDSNGDGVIDRAEWSAALEEAEEEAAPSSPSLPVSPMTSPSTPLEQLLQEANARRRRLEVELLAEKERSLAAGERFRAGQAPMDITP